MPITVPPELSGQFIPDQPNSDAQVQADLSGEFIPDEQIGTGKAMAIGAASAVAPTAGAWAGAVGMETLLSPAIAATAEIPPLAAGIALVGGVTGAVLGGKGVAALQEYLLPQSVKDKINLAHEQHPVAFDAGSIGASLVGFRGIPLKQSLAKTAKQAVVGSGIGVGLNYGINKLEGNETTPESIAVSAIQGALFTNPRFNEKFGVKGKAAMQAVAMEKAWDFWNKAPREQRSEMLDKVMSVQKARFDELSQDPQVTGKVADGEPNAGQEVKKSKAKVAEFENLKRFIEKHDYSPFKVNTEKDGDAEVHWITDPNGTQIGDIYKTADEAHEQARLLNEFARSQKIKNEPLTEEASTLINQNKAAVGTAKIVTEDQIVQRPGRHPGITDKMASLLRDKGWSDEMIDDLTMQEYKNLVDDKSPLTPEDAKVDAELTKIRDENSPFAGGGFMSADQANNRIIIHRGKFNDWLNSITPSKRAKAVESVLNEEKLHLHITDGQAKSFWDALTPLEQWAMKRRYGGGSFINSKSMTDIKWGHEAIRYHLQKHIGMTPTELAQEYGGSGAFRNRMSLHAMNAMEGIVRALRSTDANEAQVRMLDQAQKNVAEGILAGSGSNPKAVSHVEPHEQFKRMEEIAKNYDWMGDHEAAAEMRAMSEQLKASGYGAARATDTKLPPAPIDQEIFDSVRSRQKWEELRDSAERQQRPMAGGRRDPLMDEIKRAFDEAQITDTSLKGLNINREHALKAIENHYALALARDENLTESPYTAQSMAFLRAAIRELDYHIDATKTQARYPLGPIYPNDAVTRNPWIEALPTVHELNYDLKRLEFMRDKAKKILDVLSIGAVRSGGFPQAGGRGGMDMGDKEPFHDTNRERIAGAINHYNKVGIKEAELPWSHAQEAIDTIERDMRAGKPVADSELFNSTMEYLTKYEALANEKMNQASDEQDSMKREARKEDRDFDDEEMALMSWYSKQIEEQQNQIIGIRKMQRKLAKIGEGTGGFPQAGGRGFFNDDAGEIPTENEHDTVLSALNFFNMVGHEEIYADPGAGYAAGNFALRAMNLIQEDHVNHMKSDKVGKFASQSKLFMPTLEFLNKYHEMETEELIDLRAQAKAAQLKMDADEFNWLRGQLDQKHHELDWIKEQLQWLVIAADESGGFPQAGGRKVPKFASEAERAAWWEKWRGKKPAGSRNRGEKVDPWEKGALLPPSAYAVGGEPDVKPEGHTVPEGVFRAPNANEIDTSANSWLDKQFAESILVGKRSAIPDYEKFAEYMQRNFSVEPEKYVEKYQKVVTNQLRQRSGEYLRQLLVVLYSRNPKLGKIPATLDEAGPKKSTEAKFSERIANWKVPDAETDSMRKGSKGIGTKGIQGELDKLVEDLPPSKDEGEIPYEPSEQEVNERFTQMYGTADKVAIGKTEKERVAEVRTAMAAIRQQLKDEMTQKGKRQRQREKAISMIMQKLMAPAYEHDAELLNRDKVSPFEIIYSREGTTPAYWSLDAEDRHNPFLPERLVDRSRRHEGDRASVTRRLTVMQNIRSGEVLMLSTWRNPTTKEVFVTDPNVPKGNGVRLSTMMKTHRVLHSALVEPTEKFVQKWATMKDYQKQFGKPAREMQLAAAAYDPNMVSIEDFVRATEPDLTHGADMEAGHVQGKGSDLVRAELGIGGSAVEKAENRPNITHAEADALARTMDTILTRADVHKFLKQFHSRNTDALRAEYQRALAAADDAAKRFNAADAKTREPLKGKASEKEKQAKAEDSADSAQEKMLDAQRKLEDIADRMTRGAAARIGLIKLAKRIQNEENIKIKADKKYAPLEKGELVDKLVDKIWTAYRSSTTHDELVRSLKQTGGYEAESQTSQPRTTGKELSMRTPPSSRQMQERPYSNLRKMPPPSSEEMVPPPVDKTHQPVDPVEFDPVGENTRLSQAGWFGFELGGHDAMEVADAQYENMLHQMYVREENRNNPTPEEPDFELWHWKEKKPENLAPSQAEDVVFSKEEQEKFAKFKAKAESKRGQQQNLLAGGRGELPHGMSQDLWERLGEGARKMGRDFERRFGKHDDERTDFTMEEMRRSTITPFAASPVDKWKLRANDKRSLLEWFDKMKNTKYNRAALNDEVIENLKENIEYTTSMLMGWRDKLRRDDQEDPAMQHLTSQESRSRFINQNVQSWFSALKYFRRELAECVALARTLKGPNSDARQIMLLAGGRHMESVEDFVARVFGYGSAWTSRGGIEELISANHDSFHTVANNWARTIGNEMRTLATLGGRIKREYLSGAIPMHATNPFTKAFEYSPKASEEFFKQLGEEPVNELVQALKTGDPHNVKLWIVQNIDKIEFRKQKGYLLKLEADINNGSLQSTQLKLEGLRLYKTIERTIENNLVEKQLLSHDKVSYTFDEEAKWKLDGFLKEINSAIAKAKLELKGANFFERQKMRAWLKDALRHKESIEFTKAHWADQNLRDVALKATKELDLQYDKEIKAGLKLDYNDGYMPGRYDGQFNNNNSITFGPVTILGRQFSSGKEFKNYYEASNTYQAGKFGPFIAASHDISDIVEHRLRQGMSKVGQRGWEQTLFAVKDPETGLPAFAPAKKVGDNYTIDLPANVNGSNYQAVSVSSSRAPIYALKGSFSRLLSQLTSPSKVHDWAVARAALQWGQTLKHIALVGDFFHFMRVKYYAASISGPKMLGVWAHVPGWAALDFRESGLDLALQRGVLSKETVDFLREKQPWSHLGKKDVITRIELAKRFQEYGFNVGQIQDAIYRDLVTHIPLIGGAFQKYNRFLFDKYTRGFMMRTAMDEYARLSKKNPEKDSSQICRGIANDLNVYFGSIGKQGWIKSATFQDLARIMFLAPQWVEGIVKKDLAIPYKAFGSLKDGPQGMAKLMAGNETAARGIARGMVAMFALTQVVNMITRGKPTWDNPEKEQKFSAYVGDGVFVNMLAVYNEMLHDIIRYNETSRTTWGAIQRIGENKLGFFGRAALVGITGKSPTGEVLTTTPSVMKNMAGQLLPTPITFGQTVIKPLAHTVTGGWIPPVEHKQWYRQVLGVGGLKAEAGRTWEARMIGEANRFVKENNLKSDMSEVSPTDNPSYSQLRRALRIGDEHGALEILQGMRKNGIKDRQIIHSMKQWETRPFTGSRRNELIWMHSMDDAGREQRRAAVLEKRELYSKWLDFYHRQRG
jgi:hypothetical protein